MLNDILKRGKAMISSGENDRAKAVRKHRKRSPRSRAIDERRTAERVTRDYDEWAEDPSRADYPGVDDRRSRMERFSSVAPPMPNRFDEHNSPVGISEMAGYGGSSYDAMEGVDALVMDGGPDALAELDVGSNTAGGPLEMGPEESIFRDDEGWGDMNPEVDDDDDDFDWMEDL